jgi:hypothetical protein
MVVQGLAQPGHAGLFLVRILVQGQGQTVGCHALAR